MTTFHLTSPTCAYCGAFLTPVEREVNLLVVSALLTGDWSLSIRLLCTACFDDDSEEPV